MGHPRDEARAKRVLRERDGAESLAAEPEVGVRRELSDAGLEPRECTRGVRQTVNGQSYLAQRVDALIHPVVEELKSADIDFGRFHAVYLLSGLTLRKNGLT